tara:strand:- start:277 stop:546 length:270 start_codon:yes stop_codon:yes gene_type:complete
MTYNKVVSFFRNRFLSRYELDPITGQTVSLMDLISQLEDKICKMQNEIHFLKEENIENSNLIYELTENIRALDVRIDIVTAEKFIDKNV